MKTFSRNEPEDRETPTKSSPPGAIEARTKTAIRCRLCQETIVLESNFRPTAITCPHCGLKFVFDPQEEPLPVRGLRLRYGDVLETQRRHGHVQHKRHDAHVEKKADLLPPRPNYLAWAGGLVLSLAAASAIFGGWLHRLVAR